MDIPEKLCLDIGVFVYIHYRLRVCFPSDSCTNSCNMLSVCFLCALVYVLRVSSGVSIELALCFLLVSLILCFIAKSIQVSLNGT